MVKTISGTDIRIQGRIVRTARLDAEKYEFLDAPQPVLDALRNCGTRVDLFTFMQRVSETAPKYNYFLTWDNLAAVRVSTFDAWWTKQIDNKTRNMVRRGEKKGVVVREVPFDDALVRGIHQIYNECPVRQGRRFPHYGKPVETVHKETATFLDRSIFIGAFSEGQLIGFVKLVIDNIRAQAGLLNILSLIQERDKAATNVLVAQAIRSCAEREIPYLVYSNFTYGNKQRDTLSDFKRNNGFQQIEVPRYFIPLTRIGSAALRAGAHMSLADRIPETLLARARKLRNAWYSRTVLASPGTGGPRHEQ